MVISHSHFIAKTSTARKILSISILSSTNRCTVIIQSQNEKAHEVTLQGNCNEN